MSDKHHNVDRKLLEILVCPLTKGPLRYDPQTQEMISEKAALAYPIRDGIPIMLEYIQRQVTKRHQHRAAERKNRKAVGEFRRIACAGHVNIFLKFKKTGRRKGVCGPRP